MFTCLETSQNSSRSCVKESPSSVSPQGDIWSTRCVSSPLYDEWEEDLVPQSRDA